MSTRGMFTPAQATRTLPLVRRIVADILETGRELRAAAARAAGDPEARAEAEELEERVRELMAELEALGCHYKDWSFDVGLVDFPAVIDDHPVFLCWRSDEERIAWYHPIDGGYAGRARIPEHLLGGEEAGEELAGEAKPSGEPPRSR